MGLGDRVPGGPRGDWGGWKQLNGGLKVPGKDILQKNWLRLLFSDQNGGSNILPPPIGGRHRLLCFMTNIKVTNMKNTAGKSARVDPPSALNGQCPFKNVFFSMDVFPNLGVGWVLWIDNIWIIIDNNCAREDGKILLRNSGWAHILNTVKNINRHRSSKLRRCFGSKKFGAKIYFGFSRWIGPFLDHIYLFIFY